MKKCWIFVALLFLVTGCVQPGTETTLDTWLPTVSSQPTLPSQTETIPQLTLPTEPLPTEPQEPLVRDWKAIWLSQYDLWDIYRENGVQREKADFTARMATILDNIRALGFNTLFLQVRPNGDSMYPSDYYPMSKYVVGAYGVDAQYDPVEIIVALAKERGLSVHAWINPLRLMTVAEMEMISDTYLIRQWYNDPDRQGNYIVQSGQYLYLNPAYEPVRQLILDGASELLGRYDFDGLHMDDYFYPTTADTFDTRAYAELGAGMTLADFRRNNINLLVRGLYETTKAVDQTLVYGISPAGNINNVYDLQYADVYTWCAEPGYIDYICPQVYFGLEHQTHDFVKVCNTWQSIITAENVDLIIGMTFEKALSLEDRYAGTGKNEWKDNKDILKRCLEYTAELPLCIGICVFSYQHFYEPVTGTEVEGTALERSNFVPILQTITWHKENHH